MHRKIGGDKGIEDDVLEILTGMRSEVMVVFLDNENGQENIRMLGDQ